MTNLMSGCDTRRGPGRVFSLHAIGRWDEAERPIGMKRWKEIDDRSSG